MPHGGSSLARGRIVELVEKFVIMRTLLTPKGIASRLTNAVNCQVVIG